MLAAGDDLACVAAQLGCANPAATLRIHAHRNTGHAPGNDRGAGAASRK